MHETFAPSKSRSPRREDGGLVAAMPLETLKKMTPPEGLHATGNGARRSFLFFHGCRPEIALKIRNCLVWLSEKADERRLLAPLRRLLRAAATDWNDLVEDYTIAADPDIDDLLRKIADAE